MKVNVSVVLFTLLLDVGFLGVSHADPNPNVRVSGEAISGSARYVSLEQVDPSTGDGINWQLVRERGNLETGETSREVVIRSGELSIFDGYPLNAFWSIGGGRVFDHLIPATEDHPAFIESQSAIVMICAGWGGENGGYAEGICEYLPEAYVVSGIVRNGTEARYFPLGGNEQVFTVDRFRSPILSGKDEWQRFGVIFAFADCSDVGSKKTCLIGIGGEFSEPQVVFFDGTDGWSIKQVEIDRRITVEDTPKALGWTVYFKVVKDGVERTAMAIILTNENQKGKVIFHVSDDPWIN